MIDPAGSAPLARFSNPDEALSHLDAEHAGALIASAADVALVMDRDGVILDTAFSEADLSNKIGADWIGRRWVTTVSPDSRQKIEEMLGAATPTALARWRQVNHPTGHGRGHPGALPDWPVWAERAASRRWPGSPAHGGSATETGRNATGDGARIYPHPERGKALPPFVSTLLRGGVDLDSNTTKIIEANPAALTFLGIDPKKLIGQAFEALVSESSRQVSQSFLSATRVAPRVDNVHVQLERDQRSVLLTGSLYRQDGAPHLVVLLSRLGEAGGATSNDDANILRLH